MSTSFWNATVFRTQIWAGLAVLAMLMMETIVVALWYQAVFDPSQTSLGKLFAVLFLLFAASYLMLRVLDALHLRMIARQVIFVIWIMLAAFTSLKLLIYPQLQLTFQELVGLPLRYIIRGDVNGVNFFHLVWVFLLVWRGVVLSRFAVTINSVQASFQLGLVIILLYGMIYAPSYPTEAVIGLYLFLFLGLFAMSMARIANLSELRGGRIPRFGPGWILSVMFAALAVVGLAILFGWLSSGRAADFLAQVFVIIFAILTALILLILSPLLNVLLMVLPLLAEFMEQLLARFRNLPFGQQTEQLLNSLTESLGKIVPYILATRGLILLAALVGIMFAVLLALYLRGNRPKGVEEEPSEYTEPGKLDNFFQKLLHRLLNDARGLRFRSPVQMLAAARVRRIYRQLMALCEKLGAARPPSVTPLEFLPNLELLFPDQQGGLSTITAAYLKVRYGAYPETGEEVAAVQAAWERVRKQGRRTLALRKRSGKPA